MHFSKKNLIIAGGAALLVVLIIIFVVIYRRHANTVANSSSAGFNLKSGQVVKPEMLTADEKKSLDLQPSVKAQVLKRDASGQVMVYKLITASSGPVTNLSQVNVIKTASSSSR